VLQEVDAVGCSVGSLGRARRRKGAAVVDGEPCGERIGRMQEAERHLSEVLIDSRYRDVARDAVGRQYLKNIPSVIMSPSNGFDVRIMPVRPLT